MMTTQFSLDTNDLRSPDNSMWLLNLFLIRRSLLLAFFLLGLLSSLINAKIECLKENWELQSNDDDLRNARLKVVNESPMSLFLYWVDYYGDNNQDWGPKLIPVGKQEKVGSTRGHYFRIYDEQMGLLKEFRIDEESTLITATEVCHDQISKEAIDQEMQHLVHDQQAPCLPVDDSTKWSCIRHISKEEYDERLQHYGGIKYGFATAEEAQTRNVGDTEDHVWSYNIPKIPRVTPKSPTTTTATSTPGYLKMSFTDKMKEALLPYYELHKKGGPKDAVQEHRVIPGGFTNSHTVTMSILHLPMKLRNLLITEMKRVLEWWTDQYLLETATFGIRIYHRESMLINHVDRADTHIASAVLQIAQEGVDEGWPLEILHPTDGSCSEVYLQPGEMVLYEGARFRHGRPMRFNGTDFANVFTHFKPLDWHGPGKSPKYDGLLDANGYRENNQAPGSEL